MADCSSCPSKGGCASEKTGGCSTPTFLQPAEGSRILTVVAVGSGKGGVGKSTVSALLAVELARKGYRVGVLDADITGPSMDQAFGVEESPKSLDGKLMVPPKSRRGLPLLSLNLLLENKSDPVVWRGPVLGSVIKQFFGETHWGTLDCLVLDMPPGTGDVPLTVFQSLPVDRYLLVTTPQQLVHTIVEKAYHMAQKMNVPVLGLVENMAYLDCPDCDHRLYPFGEGRTAEMVQKLGLPFLDSLPMDSTLPTFMDRGEIEDVPLLDLLPKSVEAVASLIEKKKAFFAS